MKNRSVIAIISISFILISLPYLAGIFTGNSDKIFTGLILNPVDGYSYFAKMMQGYEGNWLFVLPYTANPGSPVFLFFFYILLGHVSSILHISIPVIYHITRLCGFLFLAWQLWLLMDKNINLVHISKPWSYLFILFASGMGWVGLLFGHESGDFLIPEAYPFYSSLINPHFSWGIGLFIFLLNHLLDQEKFISLLMMVASIALAVIMPFGSVILCVLISVFWLLQNIEKKKRLLTKILLICIPAVLLVGFQYYETLSHPVLQIWNQQNITPTPPVWDLLLSFFPMILLALFSLRKWKEYRQTQFQQLIFLWFIICLLMIFIPLGFQRRFLFAFAIPVTILGLFGFDDLLSRIKNPDRWKKIVFMMPSISIIFILLISLFAIFGESTYSYITKDESDLYQWINNNTKDEIVLAEPGISIKIPAYTDNTVYYGHPFETIEAGEKEKNVESWFSCESNSFITNAKSDFYSVDLVIVDKQSENGSCFSLLPIIYENDRFVLYRVDK